MGSKEIKEEPFALVRIAAYGNRLVIEQMAVSANRKSGNKFRINFVEQNFGDNSDRNSGMTNNMFVVSADCADEFVDKRISEFDEAEKKFGIVGVVVSDDEDIKRFNLLKERFPEGIWMVDIREGNEREIARQLEGLNFLSKSYQMKKKKDQL